MSVKFYAELLAKFKKANSARKIKIASDAGFGSAEEYGKFLLNNMAETGPEEIILKPTIHIIDVLDCSGSMSGSKLNGAIAGINKNVEALQESKEPVNYTYTMCNFASNYDIVFNYVKNEIADVKKMSFNARGMTALYDAILQTFEKVDIGLSPTDKILMNIYTDGEENDSKRKDNKTLEKAIRDHEAKGYTISFIGTERDVSYIQRSLGIDESNTMAYDGSAEGLINTVTETLNARNTYTKNVLSGKNVTKGFYKNIIKK